MIGREDLVDFEHTTTDARGFAQDAVAWKASRESRGRAIDVGGQRYCALHLPSGFVLVRRSRPSERLRHPDVVSIRFVDERRIRQFHEPGHHVAEALREVERGLR